MNSLNQYQIGRLADAHVKMYEGRIRSGAAHVNISETTQYLALWEETGRRNSTGETLASRQENEIEDAIECGEFRDILKWESPTHARVLDHGYIKLVETMGSDRSIIEAARMSVDKGFLGWGPFPCPECGGQSPTLEQMNAQLSRNGDTSGACSKCKNTHEVPGDERLLKHLYTNNHATPFEMGSMIIEVQAPIMVFREWHRHRTQSYNEMSARYTPLPDVNYIPTVERCMVVETKNRQAGKAAGADDLTHENALEWLEELSDVYQHAERVYQSGLRRGIPKELARLPVPVGRYSKMRASANLRNWLGFATLRSTLKNPLAQQEIRDYCDALMQIVAQAFPKTHALFAGTA